MMEWHSAKIVNDSPPKLKKMCDNYGYNLVNAGTMIRLYTFWNLAKIKHGDGT
jgi:hypothetical protein